MTIAESQNMLIEQFHSIQRIQTLITTNANMGNLDYPEAAIALRRLHTYAADLADEIHKQAAKAEVRNARNARKTA